jgi:CheY-like chemotaxis protein
LARQRWQAAGHGYCQSNDCLEKHRDAAAALLKTPPAVGHFFKAGYRRKGDDRMRALILEDDPMIGRAMMAGLKNAGYATDWLRDGQDGAGAIANDAYDMALLDLALPRRDGLDILKSLRRAHIDTPVVIVTASDAVGNRIEGIDAGADDYLTKPFDLDELLRP